MQIPEIKQRLSIATVLAHYQLNSNKNNHLQCPFHEDDKPSLRVYPDTNTYHCFGCSKSGDVIQFIQDKEQCSKHEALKKASKMAGEHIIQTIRAKPSMQTDLPGWRICRNMALISWRYPYLF